MNEDMQWSEKLKAGLSTSLDWLTGPPASASLAEILDCRESFQVPDAEQQPNLESARRLADRICNLSRKGTIEDAALTALGDMDKAIMAKLNSGEMDARIIRTGDFADVRPMQITTGTWQGPGTLILFAGLLNSLPAEHPLRTVLEPDEFYQHAGRNSNTPALILGAAQPTLNGAGTTRPFYVTSQAVSATRFMAAQQRGQWSEQDEKDRREEADAEMRFWNSEIGQQELRNRHLKRMAEQGKIPELTEPAPAVRQGKW